MSKKGYNPKLHLHSCFSTILSCGGVIGVVITSAMAIKATPKALKLIEIAANKKGGELTKLETCKEAVPVYIPALASCIATIFCVLGANLINKRNQAPLVSAYALLHQSYQAYKAAAKSVYGEDANLEIEAQMAKTAYISADGYCLYSEELDLESEKILCYDLYSQRYFIAAMASILNAQYHLNRNLSLRGNASINEFYEFLGIDKLSCGDEVGWAMDNLMENGIMWLDFENYQTEIDNSMKCCVISALWEPTVLFPENEH